MSNSLYKYNLSNFNQIGGSIGFTPNRMPNSISTSYSQTNGERRVVDSPTTFIIGDGSNLKIGKVENTAGAIGATGNGKLSIDEYVGHNLENKDKTTTKGASLSLSPSSTPVSGVGINYANRDLESVTKNTVVGNVSIGKSSGDEINKDLASMTEITKDKDTKTNVFVESQTIKYALNPSQFKEDLQIAIIEGKATGRTVVKTIDNIINGDKSQDIGDVERRSLIEIKEAIVRVQTAPAMDIIAKEDLADKNVQKELGVEIEKFDPNDPTLSEKVRERLDELKAEGKEIVAFYDKTTGKIFINQNAKDEEVRASIAREYKIKEDLELGKGKANDKGQLRSTVAGEIAYDEIKDRLKKGDKNPISASSFGVAKMDKDSEITADGYFEEGKAGLKKARAASKYTKLYEELEESGKSPEEINRILAKGNKDLKLEFGKIDKELQKERDEEKDAGKRALLVKKKMENSTDPYEQEYYKAYYNHLIRKSNPKEAFFNSAGKGAVEGIKTLVLLKILGVMPRSKPNITIPKSSKFYKDTRYPISAEDLYVISVNDPEYYKDNSHLYKVTGESNVKAGLYNKKIEDPVILKHMTEYHNNTLTSNEKLGYSVGNLGTYVVGNKILNRLDAYIYKNSNSSLVSANKITNEEQLLLENKVFINDGTPSGTTIARQTILTDSSGNMIKLQNNLTTGELSLQGINSSGQRIFEKSLIPTATYNAGNNSLVLYDKSKFLPVPVATNGTLVAPLTTNSALATVPLLTDGTNKIIRKTDFYVGPDGASSTLPATAYRYLDSKAYVETKKNMTGNLSYFGFKKFDAAYQARDGFQIKYDYYNQNDPYRSWSNAAVRGTFDTLQLYDNTTGKLKVRIPYTFGDTGKDLEPFTESYPEYGQGGELQMIRLRWDEDLIIKYDRLDILPNPRTDLILKEEIIK